MGGLDDVWLAVRDPLVGPLLQGRRQRRRAAVLRGVPPPLLLPEVLQETPPAPELRREHQHGTPRDGQGYHRGEAEDHLVGSSVVGGLPLRELCSAYRGREARTAARVRRRRRERRAAAAAALRAARRQPRGRRPGREPVPRRGAEQIAAWRAPELPQRQPRRAREPAAVPQQRRRRALVQGLVAACRCWRLQRRRQGGPDLVWL
mmetsp:Transcript_29664/g.82815  ORF Transcript_29664/g.82815 Transcript_29664/m.82815 type:complete len:205 (-) Transcript_29664:203-817(-)